MMAEQAWENLRRYKARQPLVGQILPYLTEEEAKEQGLNFRDYDGWLLGIILVSGSIAHAQRLRIGAAREQLTPIFEPRVKSVRGRQVGGPSW